MGNTFCPKVSELDVFHNTCTVVFFPNPALEVEVVCKNELSYAVFVKKPTHFHSLQICRVL